MRSCSALVSFARRRASLLVLFWILCYLHGSAQIISTRAGQTFPTHVLTGAVVNSATGAPIPWALVQADQNAKLADQNGNFRFDNLIANTVTLQAHKPGFFTEQEVNQTHAARVVNLSDRPTNVTIPLLAEAVITGQVENPEGDPLQVPVRLCSWELVNGRRVWTESGQRETDEDGNFRISDLKPGTYYVQVGPNPVPHPIGDQTASQETFEVVPAEYYPGVRDLSAASPLRLAPGQHVALQFGMKRVPAYRVAGLVTGVADGGAQNFGGLTLLDHDGKPVTIGIRFDPRSGRFQAFPVPAGSYRLHFDGRTSDGQQLYADVPINVNGNLPELRIPVAPTINIAVEFETEFTRQNHSQSASVSYDGPPGLAGSINRAQVFSGQLRLVSRIDPAHQFYAGRQKPDDPMMIRSVVPGIYDVEVDPNGAAYVASVTCGGLNLMREPLVIAEGAEPQAIRVILRDDGASLNGAVQIPEGERSASVLMVPEGDVANSPRQLYVDPSGKFQAQSLPPGDYEILAFDRLDGVEYRNREVLREFLSHAAHVTLGPEQQAKVTVDLIRTRE